MSAAVVEAIETVSSTTAPAPGEEAKEDENERQQPIDLTRIEILTLERSHVNETRFIKGLVLDHGARHPDMPDVLHNVYILTGNFSLEYEQTETSTNFVYQTAAEREKLVESERKWLDQRCRTIVQFKRALQKQDPTATLCLINQKGIDPLSLDMFAKEGMLCLRRAKRRNLDRLVHATGGQIVLSLEDLDLTHDVDDDEPGKKRDPFAILGRAGTVRQVSYGEEKWTYVEDCPFATSGTLLLQGPNALTLGQLKDGVKDGLRAVKNAIEDQAVIPGAGAFELAASIHLRDVFIPNNTSISAKTTLGIRAFSEALRVIPKTLIANAGYDVQETLLSLEEEYRTVKGEKSGVVSNPTMAVGFSVKTGDPCLPAQEGIYDNVRVKRQSIYLSTVLANQLLLVDEVMRAGKQMGRNPNPNVDDM
jgi:T-complex protein 1 subunit zeta